MSDVFDEKIETLVRICLLMPGYGLGLVLVDALIPPVRLEMKKK